MENNAEEAAEVLEEMARDYMRGMKLPFYFRKPAKFLEKNWMGKKASVRDQLAALRQEEDGILRWLADMEDPERHEYNREFPRIQEVRRIKEGDILMGGWRGCPVIPVYTYGWIVEIALWTGGRIVGLYEYERSGQRPVIDADRVLTNVEDLAVWMPRLAMWKFQRPDRWAFEAMLAETPHPELCPICFSRIRELNCGHLKAMCRHIESFQ